MLLKTRRGQRGEQEGLDDDIAVELSVATEDGSRGGKPGLILGDEMAKNGNS